jgi:hypothetical protein
VKTLTALLTGLFFAIALAFCAFQNAELWFLPVFWGDEWVHVQSAYTMASGLLELNPVRFFRLGTFNYGFLFFFQNMVGSLPFLHTHPDLVVVWPRLMSGLWFLGSLGMIGAIARRYLSWIQTWLLIIWIGSFPAFFRAGFANHPETMMVFFGLVGFWLLRDSRIGGTQWKWGIAGLAMALSAKLQAVLILPFIAFQAAFAFLFQHRRFWVFIKNGVMAVGIVIGVFVLTNPYLIHPVGRFAFLRHFRMNLLGNELRISGYTVWQKLTVVLAPAYTVFPVLVVGALGLGICVGLFWIKRREKPPLFWPSLALTWLMMWGYLLWGVNRVVPIYYIFGVLGLMAGFVMILLWIQGGLRTVVLALFVAAHMTFAYPTLASFFHRDVHYADQLSVKNFIHNSLKPIIRPTDAVLISSATAINSTALGLDPTHIYLIHGPLTLDMIDEASFYKKWQHVPASRFKTKVFQPKAFIIIRKNTPTHSLVSEATAIDKDFSSPDGHSLLLRLLEGGYGYRLIGENKDVWIFQYIL